MSEINTASKYLEICHIRGIFDPEMILTSLIRAIRTKALIIEPFRADRDQLYATMQNISQDLGRFPGDADLFYQMYESLEKIDSRGIFTILSSFSNKKFNMIAPACVVDRYAEYITDKTKTVFVPECENYDEALLDLVRNYPDVKFTLAGRNAEVLEILRYAYADQNNVSLDLCDIYREGFSTDRYDLICAIPIFGMRHCAEKQDFISHDSDMVALQNLLYHISLDGTLAIILPARIMFATGSIAALREYIETNYRIHEIDALPQGLFAPYTSIRTYMFTFRNGSTEEVLVRRFIQERDGKAVRLVSDVDEILFPDEFSDLNGWNIEIAFSDAYDELREYNQSLTKKVALRDIATVFRGKATGPHDPNGKIGVINISNLTGLGIDYENLDMLDEEERKVARYALQTGDVLVTSRGTTIKVAVFEDQNYTCIPSANFNVIRPDKRLRGAYLKLFLESPVGVKLLKSVQRGTAVMNLNYKDLGTLEIPLLPLEEQDALVEEYRAGFTEYQKTITAAEIAWNSIKEEIQAKLY